MVDQNTFINTYIDIIVNTLTEQIKANLQLQTQVKINEFVVAEKDKIISSLTAQLNDNKVAENWKVKYEAAEANYSSILAKLSHMDTLLAQIGDMKKIILEKDKEIEELKSPKKVINTKITKAKEQSLSIVNEEKSEKKIDDF